MRIFRDVISGPPDEGAWATRDDRAVTDVIPAERLPARRRSRGAHPAAGEPLRQRVLAERERISRTSRVREFVLGFQDGLPTTGSVSAAMAVSPRRTARS